MRIAVLDKDDFQRHILVLLFESIGQERIESYKSCDEIAEPFARGDLAVVTFDLFEEVRARFEAELPTLIVTGQERHERLLAECFAKGAAAALFKPFTKEGLETAVNDARLMRESAS